MPREVFLQSDPFSPYFGKLAKSFFFCNSNYLFYSSITASESAHYFCCYKFLSIIPKFVSYILLLQFNWAAFAASIKSYDSFFVSAAVFSTFCIFSIDLVTESALAITAVLASLTSYFFSLINAVAASLSFSAFDRVATDSVALSVFNFLISSVHGLQTSPSFMHSPVFSSFISHFNASIAVYLKSAVAFWTASFVTVPVYSAFSKSVSAVTFVFTASNDSCSAVSFAFLASVTESSAAFILSAKGAKAASAALVLSSSHYTTGAGFLGSSDLSSVFVSSVGFVSPPSAVVSPSFAGVAPSFPSVVAVSVFVSEGYLPPSGSASAAHVELNNSATTI